MKTLFTRALDIGSWGGGDVFSLSTVQELLPDEGDRIFLKGTGDGSSSIKFLYKALDTRSALLFLNRIVQSS